MEDAIKKKIYNLIDDCCGFIYSADKNLNYEITFNFGSDIICVTNGEVVYDNLSIKNMRNHIKKLELEMLQLKGKQNHLKKPSLFTTLKNFFRKAK